MAKRVGRDDRHKKAKRFASLRQRRLKKATLYVALERRQRDDNLRLKAARKRCVNSTGHPKTPTIERRRHEYIEIPSLAPATAPRRAGLVSIGVAFALPLVIALLANLPHAPSPSNVVTRGSRPDVGVRVAARIPSHPNTAPAAQHTHSPQNPSAYAVQHVRNQPRVRSEPARVSLATPASIAAPAARPVTQTVASAMPRLSGSVAVETPAAPTKVALAPRNPVPAIHHKSTSGWSLSPDGTWTAVIHAPGGVRDPSFSVSTGQVIALERSAVDSDAATVTIGWSRPVDVTISSSTGSWSKSLPAPDDGAAAFEATARAVGPHLVNVGWTPLSQAAGVVDYKIYRSSTQASEPQLVAQLPASKHAWHDASVSPDDTYRYDVVAETTADAIDANTLSVTTPDELPAAPASVLAGKGMFLYFSSLQNDARFFRHYHPEAVIAEAQKAGIRVIELRMARGTCAMAQTAEARAWLDHLIDAAAQRNISLIAWTVPRRVTTQDIAQTVAAAAYKTTAGNGFAGLALDLETGDRYMGNGRKASASLVQYIKTVRLATGPRYLIVATVASPGLGNHTNADYPYARIAAFADVLQPMEYWHYFYETAHHEYERREVAGAAAAAVARTRELAGRDIPVNVAGQSVDLEGTGAPSGREISWSLHGAKSAGGIGETFFDWAGTRPDAWAAIQAFDW